MHASDEPMVDVPMAFSASGAFQRFAIILQQRVSIAADEVEAWAKRAAAEHGFTSAAHVVDVFGLCENCTRTLAG